MIEAELCNSPLLVIVFYSVIPIHSAFKGVVVCVKGPRIDSHRLVVREVVVGVKGPRM